MTLTKPQCPSLRKQKNNCPQDNNHAWNQVYKTLCTKPDRVLIDVGVVFTTSGIPWLYLHIFIWTALNQPLRALLCKRKIQNDLTGVWQMSPSCCIPCFVTSDINEKDVRALMLRMWNRNVTESLHSNVTRKDTKRDLKKKARKWK